MEVLLKMLGYLLYYMPAFVAVLQNALACWRIIFSGNFSILFQDILRSGSIHLHLLNPNVIGAFTLQNSKQGGFSATVISYLDVRGNLYRPC